MVNSISSALIGFNEFQKNYGLIYFDLSKTGNALDSDSTNLNIRYTLSGTPSANYKPHALVLYESGITLKNIDKRAYLETN